MVQIGLPALAFLATISMVAAAPAETKAFTFSQWIEDIIANPDGDHLSPEQAVAAKLAAIESDGSLGKRAWCQAGFADANANDASACLRDLAAKGSRGQECVIGDDQFNIQMCHIGNAQVVASKADRPRAASNCNDVARAGGFIFDACFRSDNTVKGSENNPGNGRMQINILGA